tara:strand:- start:62 stop:241 length:180 start_codon:yes stop_codon:yes gene_type:complete
MGLFDKPKFVKDAEKAVDKAVDNTVNTAKATTEELDAKWKSYVRRTGRANRARPEGWGE